MSERRWYDQPDLGGFKAHPSLGVATLRTDLEDGTATYRLQVAEPGYRGLYLDTGFTFTGDGTTFEVPGAAGPLRSLHAAARSAAAHYSMATTPTTAPQAMAAA